MTFTMSKTICFLDQVRTLMTLFPPINEIPLILFIPFPLPLLPCLIKQFWIYHSLTAFLTFSRSLLNFLQIDLLIHPIINSLDSLRNVNNYKRLQLFFQNFLEIILYSLYLINTLRVLFITITLFSDYHSLFKLEVNSKYLPLKVNSSINSQKVNFTKDFIIIIPLLFNSKAQ